MQFAPNPTNNFEDGASQRNVDTVLTPELRQKVTMCESMTSRLGAIGFLCKMTAEAAARGAANDDHFHDSDLYTRKKAANDDHF